MPIDSGAILGNQKSLIDYQRLQQAFEQQQALQTAQTQSANVDAQQKSAALVGQQLYTAASTGDPSIYQATKQKLGQSFDVSNYSDDPATALQQANAARTFGATPTALLNAALQEQQMSQRAGTSVGNIGAYGWKPGLQPIAGGVVSKPQPISLPQNNSNPGMNLPVGNPNSAIPGLGGVTGAQVNAGAALPPQNTGETLDAYKTRLSNDPALKQQLAAAESSGTASGKEAAENSAAAVKAQALTDQLAKNIQGLKAINGQTPYGFNASAAPFLNQHSFGAIDPTAAKNAALWHQVNMQDTLNEVRQFLASGGAGARINQTLDRMMQKAAAIDIHDSPATRGAALDAAWNEIQNKDITAQNIKAGTNGGAQAPYNDIIPDVSTLQNAMNAKKGVIDYKDYFK